MQDILYEECVECVNSKNEKIKYYLLFTFSILSFFLALLCFYIVINFVNINTSNVLIKMLIAFIPSVAFIVIGVMLLNFKNNFCLDYDYIFVSGSLRISKIVKKVLRKDVIKFNTDQIGKIGPINSKFSKKILENKAYKKLILSANDKPLEGKDFYYITVFNNGENYMLILECTKQLIVNLLKFSKRTVKDEELI